MKEQYKENQRKKPKNMKENERKKKRGSDTDQPMFWSL